MNISKKNRYFIWHLISSIFIGTLLVALVFFVWFPHPLASAEGVIHIFLLLLAIDIILGPLLSLLVYKEGKKSLKIDLAIIIIIQVVALCYGMYAIAKSRPVWIVQNGEVFQLVRANSILDVDQRDAKPKFRKNSWTKPQWAAVDDTNKKYWSYGEPILVPNLYVDISNASLRIQKNARPLDELNNFNNVHSVDLELQKNPGSNAWMPLRTADLSLVVLIDKDKGAVINIVNLKPWIE